MIIRLTVLLVVLAAFSPAGGNGNTTAWVLQCNGNWEDQTDPSHILKIGCSGARGEILWHKLHLNSKIVVTSRKPKQWISVRIASTGEVHRFNCDTPGECDPPPLPFGKYVPPMDTGGMLNSFFEAPGNAYSRIRLMMSRGAQEDAGFVTVDYAVATEGENLTAASLLRPSVKPGEYLLEICPFDEHKGCPAVVKPVRVKWNPDSPVLWSQRLQRGLYEIVLDQVDHDLTLRTKDRGLLLIASKVQFSDAVKTMKAGEDLFLKTWKDKSEGRLMFQALLLDIASRGR